MNAEVFTTEIVGSILVVDDDPRVRELMCSFLAQHGYRTEGAADAAGMDRILQA
jgi:two-component system OmpR family response regulator